MGCPHQPWYTNLVADATAGDFVAIKLGDVDNFWTAPSGAGFPGKEEESAGKERPRAAGPGEERRAEVVFAVSQQSAQSGQTAAPVTVSGFSQVSGAHSPWRGIRRCCAMWGTGSYGARGLSGACFGTTLSEREADVRVV